MTPRGGLSLRGLRVAYGAAVAVDDVSLDIGPGEFMVLLGPSGCGKSTLLNAVCGLQEMSAGQVLLGGRDITRLEPGERDIAMVFQSHALYPTMTVARNITFALRMRGVGRSESAARLAEVARLLRIEPLLARRPAGLSGGERQRVAMARAIIRNPALFLFDEPLSSLDARLRAELRGELKDLQRRLRTAALYVTHDQVDAMAMADRVAVMRAGRILQVGPPDEIYARPADLFVAGFVGPTGMNLIPGRVGLEAGLPVLAAGDVVLPLHRTPCGSSLEAGRQVVLGLRAEDIGPDPGGAAFVAELAPLASETTGPDLLLRLRLGAAEVTARIPQAQAVPPGRPLRLAFDLSRATLFCARTGRRL